MSDSIPLYDGPPTEAKITHPHGNDSNAPSPDGAESGMVRGSRRNARHDLDGIKVCLATHDASGRVEFTDCPVVDISVSGMGLEFDRRIKTGLHCNISYRTRDRSTVHVGGVIRRCLQIGVGRFQLGIQFDRHLNKPELLPARVIAGAPASPLQRGRQLRSTTGSEIVDPSGGFSKPLIIEPTAAGSDEALGVSDETQSDDATSAIIL